MRKYALLITLAVMFVVPASANASTPYLTKQAAWSKTFDFAHGIADRMDDGSYEDVIPIVNDCVRQSRSRVDCDYEVNFFPWSLEEESAMTCTSTIRIRKYNSGAVRVYIPGRPTCVTI
jgi:hypothetical protein